MTHRCSCGRSYDHAAWCGLRFVGLMACESGLTLELRDCACGSTMAAPLLPLPAELDDFLFDTSRRESEAA